MEETVADVEQTHSYEINELVKALVKVQSELENVHKSSTNPFFKSNYADLTAVWDACRKPLSKNGLAVIQTMKGGNGRMTVVTTLAHTSGQWIKGELSLKPVKDDPQACGSAITYARRYSLQAIVGICPEDDDGEGAMDREKKKQAPPKEAPKKSAQKDKSEKPKTMNYDFLQSMGKAKKMLGDKIYYPVIGAAGYTHANEITDPKEQKAILSTLRAHVKTEDLAAKATKDMPPLGDNDAPPEQKTFA